MLGANVKLRDFGKKVVIHARSYRVSSPYRVLECIGILFYLFVFYSFLFDLVCEVRHGEAGVNATTVFFETVINKLVLILKSWLQINKKYGDVFAVGLKGPLEKEWEQ